MAAPDPLILDCGCLIVCDEATMEMRISPCRADCKVLAMTLDIARQEGKPVEYRTPA